MATSICTHCAALFDTPSIEHIHSIDFQDGKIERISRNWLFQRTITFRGTWQQFLWSCALHVNELLARVEKDCVCLCFSWSRWDPSIGQTFQEARCRWKRCFECARVHVRTWIATEPVSTTRNRDFRYGWQWWNWFQRWFDSHPTAAHFFYPEIFSFQNSSVASPSSVSKETRSRNWNVGSRSISSLSNIDILL